jgi:hypothetical protein
MKKLMILSAIAVSGLMAQSANAQIGIHINLHLGGAPVYVAPAPVYNDDDYYYLPDVEAYYSVSQNCYYYNDGYNWVSAAYLPGAYRNYDWRYARRIEVKEARPYMHNDVYRARYGGAENRNWNYRDEHDNRMYADRDHDQNRGYADHNNYGRMQEPQRDDHNFNRGQQQPQQNDNHAGFNRGGQQQAQPQQNDNHGGFNRGGQQQAQPQQNDNHAGFNRGGQQQAQPQQNDNHGGSNRGGQQQAQPQQNNNHSGSNNSGQEHFAQNRISGPIARPARF